MKILLTGYGKMGHAIEKVALERGHHIAQIINSPMDSWDSNGAEIVIDFSVPKTAYGNIMRGLELKLPVISGTTGWLHGYEEIVSETLKKKGAFLYSSNFSLGVNLFFELNKRLTELMKDFKEYKPLIEEIHHIQKLDAPSGTAITLAEAIIKEQRLDGWSMGQEKNKLPITSMRVGEVTGIHEIIYRSEADKISIRHEAFNRKGFALGALLAAEWLIDKRGVFGMKDVLGF